MRKQLLTAVILSAAVLAAACSARPGRGAPGTAPAAWRGPEIWQSEIAAFERADAAGAHPANAVLFVGSSSIRLWDLEKYFPGLPAVNRGFGGSYISDSVYYARRLTAPCKPRLIVFYAGDNDIADGKPPARLAADLGAFVAAAREELPQVPVIYISIKPSPARWRLWPKIREANGLIKAYCLKQVRCSFLDVGTAMLGPDGKPAAGLYQADGLHLTDKGYRLWSGLLAPLLAEEKIK